MIPPVSLEWPPQTPACAPVAKSGSQSRAATTDLQRIGRFSGTLGRFYIIFDRFGGQFIRLNFCVRRPSRPSRGEAALAVQGFPAAAPAGGFFRSRHEPFGCRRGPNREPGGVS